MVGRVSHFISLPVAFPFSIPVESVNGEADFNFESVLLRLVAWRVGEENQAAKNEKGDDGRRFRLKSATMPRFVRLFGRPLQARICVAPVGIPALW